MDELKTKINLTNWSVIILEDDQYARLKGTVSDSESESLIGLETYSSPIMYFDSHLMQAKTINAIYNLEKINSDFAEQLKNKNLTISKYDNVNKDFT